MSPAKCVSAKGLLIGDTPQKLKMSLCKMLVGTTNLDLTLL